MTDSSGPIIKRKGLGRYGIGDIESTYPLPDTVQPPKSSIDCSLSSFGELTFTKRDACIVILKRESEASFPLSLLKRSFIYEQT